MGRRVKRGEAEIIKRGIEPGSRYLRRVLDRMYAKAFDQEDEIFIAVKAADDALHSLWVKLHYQSFRGPNGIIDPDLDMLPRSLLLTFLF